MKRGGSQILVPANCYGRDILLKFEVW